MTKLADFLDAFIILFFQVFLELPYRAVTTPRHRQLESRITIEGSMISDKVYKLCTSQDSVSALLAADPSLAPAEAWKKLYGGHQAGEKESVATARAHRDNLTTEDRQRAKECGKWGSTEPSDLFLRLYHDALCCIDKSVSSTMTSPSLMGSSGTIPLVVLSVVPDIMRHMSNMIIRAEKEVYLATNYWQNSIASKYITNAMKELSRRAGERGEKVVFKLIYDRGSPKQFLDNHYVVSEKEMTGKAVALPAPEEIPNIDLQVMNYHKPLLGTFHCKYMIVDRRQAMLQSNNIQDNDNLEMAIRLEGPIVDSLYDMALISWSKTLDPPLPSHNSPATQGGLGSFGNKSHNDIFGPNGSIKGHHAVIHPDHLRNKPHEAYAHEHREINAPGVLNSQAGNEASDPTKSDYATGPTTTESIVHPTGQNGDDPREFSEQKRHHSAAGHEDPIPIAQDHKSGPTAGDFLPSNLAFRQPKTQDADQTVRQENAQKEPVMSASQNAPTAAVNTQAPGPDSRTTDFLHSGEQVLPQSRIEEPVSDSNILPEHTTDDPHYDVDIAGEVARVQSAVSPKASETRVEATTRHLNHTKNPGFKGNAPEPAPEEEMTPLIPIPAHEPFPIAMVCREPYGPPNNKSVYQPQNEVWLSALRNAKKNVFIQSPTLNAEPLVPAIIEACERGIDVFCYICLGYNDDGELLPMQGGTNNMISHKLFTSLSAAAKKNLHYFWYIGKDQVAPIVAKKKKRSCHVKLMIVDEHIGIQGNGNQDTQSWFHSQEINVMFDSEYVCRAIIDGLRRNQNTHLYGEVSQEDGVWRDVEGKGAEDIMAIDPGHFSFLKGIVGAVKRVQGTGDF